MSLALPTFQNNGCLCLFDGGQAVVNLTPVEWQTRVGMASGVGEFHFDCPVVTRGVKGVAPERSRLYSYDVCMHGDVMSSSSVASQIPPLWRDKLRHGVFYTWKSMKRGDVHFVTIWSSVRLDPCARWGHVENLRLPTCPLLSKLPEVGVIGNVIYKGGRRAGRVRRGTVIAPKWMKGVRLSNFCADEVGGRCKVLVPNAQRVWFVHVEKIVDSDHMQDCAYDVVVGYTNK